MAGASSTSDGVIWMPLVPTWVFMLLSYASESESDGGGKNKTAVAVIKLPAQISSLARVHLSKQFIPGILCTDAQEELRAITSNLQSQVAHAKVSAA